MLNEKSIQILFGKQLSPEVGNKVLWKISSESIEHKKHVDGILRGIARLSHIIETAGLNESTWIPIIPGNTVEEILSRKDVFYSVTEYWHDMIDIILPIVEGWVAAGELTQRKLQFALNCLSPSFWNTNKYNDCFVCIEPTIKAGLLESLIENGDFYRKNYSLISVLILSLSSSSNMLNKHNLERLLQHIGVDTKLLTQVANVVAILQRVSALDQNCLDKYIDLNFTHSDLDIIFGALHSAATISEDKFYASASIVAQIKQLQRIPKALHAKLEALPSLNESKEESSLLNLDKLFDDITYAYIYSRIMFIKRPGYNSEMECIICNTTDSDYYVKYECGHAVHDDCLRPGIKHYLNDSKCEAVLHCQYPGCNCTINPIDLVAALQNDDLIKLQRIAIAETPQLRLCPACPDGFEIVGESSLFPDHCNTCGEDLCFGCGAAPHAGKKCDLSDTTRSDTLFFKYVQKTGQDDKYRKCPNCFATIERISGCNAMRCGRDVEGDGLSRVKGCGSSFDWYRGITVEQFLATPEAYKNIPSLVSAPSGPKVNVSRATRAGCSLM